MNHIKVNPGHKRSFLDRFLDRYSKQNKRMAELMDQVEQLRELWRIERLHKDAIRDREKEEQMEREFKIMMEEGRTPPETRIVELIKMLQKGESVENCDTSHRFYLTGEQYDFESFEVQNEYRFCPRCKRFFNRTLLNNRCYCDIEENI